MNTIPHPLANLPSRPPKRKTFVEFVQGEAPFSCVEHNHEQCPVCDEPHCTLEYNIAYKGARPFSYPPSGNPERLFECVKCGAAYTDDDIDFDHLTCTTKCAKWVGDR